MSDRAPERICVRWGKAAGDVSVSYMEDRFYPPDNTAEYIRADLAALPPAQPDAPLPATVAHLVPEHCTGTALAFDPGTLHINKDGSGYIAIDEKHFECEDDRTGEGGSVNWITRMDASEMTALRDFLINGTLRAPDAVEALVKAADQSFFELVVDGMAEADRAMRKFPQPNYVISKVAEEAGEVVKAAIHCAEGRETTANVQGEMKQLIAMLYRLWVEGDQVHGLAAIRAGGKP